MTARLIVCTTCDRYAAPPSAPSRGAVLAATVERRAAERGVAVAVTRVDCLDGCPRPSNAALRARGKPFRRFSGLGPDDADALIDAALGYAADPAGRAAPAKLSARETTPAR